MARWPVRECLHETTDQVTGFDDDGVQRVVQEICVDCCGSRQRDGSWA